MAYVSSLKAKSKLINSELKEALGSFCMPRDVVFRIHKYTIELEKLSR